MAAAAAASGAFDQPMTEPLPDNPANVDAAAAAAAAASNKNGPPPDDGAQRDHTPATVEEYQQAAYWDARFAEEDSYEWCKDWSTFSHLVLPHIKPSDRVLELGCGNSSMAVAMAAQHGFRHITCTDLSSTVVARMQTKADAAGHSIRYQVADMLDLPFESGSFDVVMEKGVLDIFTATEGYDPWNPPKSIRTKIATVMAGVHRVLRPGGVFASITFAQPHFRLPLLLRPGAWIADPPGRFGGTFHYFVYVLRRQNVRAAEAAAGCITAPSESDGTTQDYEEQAQQGSDGFGGLVVRSREPGQEGAMHEHMDNEDYLLTINL